MPELPEVETIVRNLREKLIGLQIGEVKIFLKKCIQGSGVNFEKNLIGRRISAIERRGKYIIIHLDHDLALIIHLRMTGSLLFLTSAAPIDKHTHLIFTFLSPPWQLRFVDQRQFGRLCLAKKGEKGALNFLEKLGPEPLQISSRQFRKMIKGKRRIIKSLLLDQTFIAGVGNIYADEVLYRTGLHPRQKTEYLSPQRVEGLLKNLQALLRQAIRERGTSVRNYVDAQGVPGGFQKYLLVYGREGEKCSKCGAIILREKIAGRSTYYCPKCQPLIFPKE
ncbi:MAG: bifunctional DNA-formamidopyrimidine glycosylase/DNA-(apurinic or apyrimidinic site) lyase [Thermodesulfobacteriota bacterium]